MTDITICPFCLTVHIYELYIGDECPDCEIGILEDLNKYYERKAAIDEEDKLNDR
jgi:hypothetical protein